MKFLKATLPLIVAAVAFSAVPAIKAGVDIDLGAAVKLNDRTDLYFSISSRYFDRDRETIDRWGRRYRDPDDLAVALFIARHCGRDLDEIWALRQQRGLTWWELSVRWGIPADVWFVRVERDPGPPYGKAYGHWKKHRHDRRRVMVLSDQDLRNLVAVRMAHEYYGVSVDVAMDWRADGRNLRDLMSEEYARRHGRHSQGSRVAASSSSEPGKGRGKGKGKGHKNKKNK